MRTSVRCGLRFSYLIIQAVFFSSRLINAADLTAGGSFAAGSNSIAVAVGDFNRDGRADLAVANQQAESVSILLGNGDATFQTAVNYATGHFPQSVAVGDLNRDGKQDVVVANAFDPGSVSVFIGNGDGTFQSGIPYATGADPTSVTIGDFNSDRKPDLATANYLFDGSVSVLLGYGDGSFGTATNYPVGRWPFSIATGLFNTDGKQDLIVPNDTNPGFVYSLLGNGNGTFQTATSTRTGRFAESVIVADFNGDGRADVATANYASVGTVSVLLGNGNGTFQTAVSYNTGPFPAFLSVMDCNRDSRLDLIVIYDTGPLVPTPDAGVSLLLGLGDGTFDTASNFTVGSGPISLAVGDFNRDHKPDIAVANYNNGTVSLLLNTTPGVELGIERTGGNAKLSWIYPSTGYTLKSTTSLTSPNWQPVSETAVNNNGIWEVTVPITQQPRFFRLHEQ